MVSREGSGKKHRLAIVLATLVAVLTVLHVGLLLLKSRGILTDLTPWFDLDNEYNVPSAYNAFLWAQCGLLVAFLAVRSKVGLDRPRFGLIAAFFLYLGFDELLILHESLAQPIRDALSISGGNPLYHAWVVPAIAVALALTVLYISLRFAKGSNKLQRNLVLYVLIVAGGVIGLEMLGTQLYFSELVYKLGPVLIEEVFEMGMASFILYKLSGEFL